MSFSSSASWSSSSPVSFPTLQVLLILALHRQQQIRLFAQIQNKLKRGNFPNRHETSDLTELTHCPSACLRGTALSHQDILPAFLICGMAGVVLASAIIKLVDVATRNHIILIIFLFFFFGHAYALKIFNWSDQVLCNFQWNTREIFTISNDAQCSFLKEGMECLFVGLVPPSTEVHGSPYVQEFPTFYSSIEK